jgi:cytochrome P450
VLDSIKYISPGPWLVWRSAPRPRYRRSIQTLDQYLYARIRERRRELGDERGGRTDLLSVLIQAGLDDDLIRDQVLTLLIAGHDTSTALLAWTFYLLGSHPESYQRVQGEARGLSGSEPPAIGELNRLDYLGQALKESLRLYPPIHLGNRQAAADLEFNGYHIPAGERVIYSIYLTQRHPEFWPQPDRFIPERHAPGARPVPYTWLPFGGGPRNCIGGAFGLLEAKLVLARILLEFDVRLQDAHIRPHMGATLEPHPGVRMRVFRW